MFNIAWAADNAPVSPLVNMLPFVLMFVVIYFLMIRPQQRKAKEHAQLLKNIQRDDEVVTSSGIYGTVTGVTDSVVTVEIADNVRVKVLKSHIAGKVLPNTSK